MNKSFIFVLLYFLVVLCFPTENAHAYTGVWSSEATHLASPDNSRADDKYRRYIEVASPDGKKIAVIDDFSLGVKVNGKLLPGLHGAGVGDPKAELLWSPDSRAFFITEFDEAVGEWRVFVYIIMNGKIREIAHIEKNVKKDFMKQYRCNPDKPEIPNEEPHIGAVTWLNKPNQLLLVAEVPPHSSCPEMGMIVGYIVSVPSGKIIKILDEKEVRTKWGNKLGREFQQSP